MSTPTDLATIIGFGLSRLRIQNRHHDFEHLCRDLARARIASNILPATGPVAGSGDQGRDFETFHTYLANTLTSTSTFIGRAASNTITFACTVQQNGLLAKISADVKAICSQGTPVQRIYFFCTEPLRTSDRHNAQDWTSREYGIALEVLDGPAISELLSEHDVFWIAKTHLHLPAELTPPSLTSRPASAPTRKASIQRADHEMAKAIDLLASRTTRPISEFNPLDFRAAFASDLRALLRLSGSPELSLIAAKVECQESQLIDYMSGNHLPSQKRTREMVRAMAEFCRERGIDLPDSQFEEQFWARKLRVARKSGMQKTVKHKALKIAAPKRNAKR
ncbi:hypothetical protein [Streptomyces uncialis]|uniref:hypothetical protein n=1 Tax=Streptomyces uncialis TaxID=1048205 RepID=UPI0033FEBB8B